MWWNHHARASGVNASTVDRKAYPQIANLAFRNLFLSSRLSKAPYFGPASATSTAWAGPTGGYSAVYSALAASSPPAIVRDNVT